MSSKRLRKKFTRAKVFQLHSAIISSNENKVLALIKAGVDVDSVVSHGKPALFFAVSGGQSKIVEALVQAGANVNITDDDGKTPLFYCADMRHREEFLRRERLRGFHMHGDLHEPRTDFNSVASTLIEAGADVNVTDDEGKTALMHALQNENAELACKLINSGADVKAVDENGRTALFYPCSFEGSNVLQKLLKSVDINFTDHWGKTALMVAVEQNQRKVAELIEAGADVNVTDDAGKTALMYALQNKNAELACKLIDSGTDVNVTDDEGKTALMYALQNKNAELACIKLINSGADVKAVDENGRTALFYPCSFEGSNVLQKLLKSVDINFTDHWGKTALMVAVEQNQRKVAELIEAGADVNVTDDAGKTALMYALQNKNMKLAGRLINRGADVKAVDENGRTALFYPSICKNTSVFQKLLKSVDVNFTDNLGKTALMEAVEQNQEGAVAELIKAGADVNVTDKQGKTAMVYCVQHQVKFREQRMKPGHPGSVTTDNNTVASMLIKSCADINISDIEGKTALLYSLQDGNESLACALIEAGADVNITDKESKTALIYCAQNQKERMYHLHKPTSSSNSSESDTVTCSRVASLLIKSCTNMNKTDNEGKTALIHSLQEGNESLACALIEAGADVNVVDDDGKTALFYAAIYNNKKLAVNSPDSILHYLNLKDKATSTQLHQGVIHKLLEAGADANLTDKQGRTPLMYYAENEYINIIHEYLKMRNEFERLFAHVENEYNHVASALIKASKDVNIVDNQGKTALAYFLQNNKDSCAIELIDAGADVNIADVDGKTLLFYIPPDCNKNVIDKIIKSSKSINITDNEGKTALVYSLQENNESLACALIKVDADVTIVDKTGRNALFYATIKGYKNVFSKLINSIDINVIDNQGKTVLMHAVQRVNTSFISQLIDSGAEVNVSDKDGKTALTYCAQSALKLSKGGYRLRYKMPREDYQAFVDKVKSKVVMIASMLIEAGADVNKSDNEGKTALYYSLQEDDDDHLSSALIKAGADLSIQDKNGKTVLSYAVIHNRRNVVKDLIDAGADVNLCDPEGKTALIYCAQSQVKIRQQLTHGYQYYLSSRGCLLGRRPGGDPTNHNAVAFMLIKACANVNITDNKGRTALMYSLLYGNKDLACALVGAGAEVNAVDQDGKTAFFYALIGNKGSQKLLRSHSISESEEETTSSLSVQDRESLVIKLIDAGADVNLTYDKGKTALVYSARNCNTSLVSALIKAGADVNAADDKGKTALIHCLSCDSNKRTLRKTRRFYTNHVAFTLIKAGANVNVTDDKGKTALIYCIQSNNEEMVPRLIDAGADANITDDDGSSAIFYGIGNDEIVCLLINKGEANVNKRDRHGRAPIYYAMKESLTSARQLLDNGSSLKRKDCYGISILSFFIEHSLNEKVHMSKGLNLLQEKGIQQEAIFEALVNSLFCRFLNLQVRKQHGFLSQKPDLKLIKNVLNIAMEYAPRAKCEDIKDLTAMVEEAPNLCKTILKILESLVELGANPSYADIDGNTALHYATCLPLAGAPQDTVMKICHQLDELGASVHAKNHKKETPLLFCLSKKDWINKGDESTKLKSLVEVCSFLLKHRSSVEETTQDEKSLFHLIIEIFKQGLCLHNDAVQKDILKESLALLHLFSSSHVTKGVTVNKRDRNLNSPLHLWAMLELSLPSSDHQVFEKEKEILTAVFKHLKDCGAKINDVNKMDQTPLHLCNTWTAAKLLIDAGAKTNVLDSEGSTPLLVTVKRNQNDLDESDACCIYPDVLQQPREFWKTVLKNKLDPWTVNNHGTSLMSILVESEAFVLAKALLDVACEGKHIETDAIAISLLNAICKDQSTSAQWKSILVGQVLKSRKSAIHQMEGEDTPLHYCCRNIARKKTEDLPFRRRNFHDLDESSVHWTIVKQLLSHGFNCSAVDTSGQSCTAIAKKCPALEDLLTKPLNIDEVPLVIPWKSFSKTHQPALAKVARRQECRQVSSFSYHQNNIQKGSFGLVFVGINEKDGREVAIKRTEKLRMHRPEDKREITSLTTLADCEQVVRYLFFFEDEDFSYIVLELMEGNLTDYLEDTCLDEKRGIITLCADVVKGLKYLHVQRIIHRDLKPSNILFKTFPKLCLKIADFGLSRCIDKCSTSATVYGSVAGTRCWIAPEVLKSSYKEHSKESDVFSCGLLLHYILIVKQHPFSPVDCANKCELQIHNETEANMLRDSREGWDPGSLFPEATDLINSMLDSVKTKRPTAAEALAHPMFWPKKKKMEFFSAVGNQPEVECSRAKRVPPLTQVEIDLEKSFTTIVTEKTWDDSGYVNMSTIYAEMTKKRAYNTCSIVELLRFIRNTHAHVSEDKRPTSIRKQVLEDFVFLECFPNLVMEVFKCIKTHGWDSREEIKYALDDEMANELKGCAEDIPEDTLTDMEND